MKLSILKTVFLAIVLFFTTALFITEIALSQPLPLELAQIPMGTPMPNSPAPQPTPSTPPSEQPPVPQPSPLPSATGQPQPPASDQSKSTKSAGPYDMEAIKAFNRALYGS